MDIIRESIAFFFFFTTGISKKFWTNVNNARVKETKCEYYIGFPISKLYCLYKSKSQIWVPKDNLLLVFLIRKSKNQ